MKVLVTGATGFTGSYVVPRLLEDGCHVTCFVRTKSDTKFLPIDRIHMVTGSLEQPETLLRALREIDILVNIASLGFGHAADIVKAAERARVTRAVFISTTALFTSLNAPSKIVRLAAEESIKKSTLNFTIVRPTMIYGSSRDRNMCRLIKFLHFWPIIPIFGSGKNLQQPVFVEDLACAISRTIRTKSSVGKCYNISGADALTYNEIVDTVCRILQRRVWKCHLPAGVTVALLRIFERSGVGMPIKAEQVLRLNEDKAFDHVDAARDFGFRPRTFADGIKTEIAEMGLIP